MPQPLHVEVAVALGWTKLVGHCKCLSPAREHQCDRIWWGTPPRVPARPGPVPRYDVDWGATGPLLERFDISLQQHAPGGGWIASSRVWPGVHRRGTSALESVCHLLRRLAQRRPRRATDPAAGREQSGCCATLG